MKREGAFRNGSAKHPHVLRFTACKPSKDFRRLDLDLLRDRRQGHRLIVQVTVACGVGGDFAVRIEADLLGLLRQDVERGLEFFFGTLAQDQAAFVYRYRPPFGAIQLAYQRGTAAFGERSDQGDTLFIKLTGVF